jgi:hypothetical protein
MWLRMLGTLWIWSSYKMSCVDQVMAKILSRGKPNTKGQDGYIFHLNKEDIDCDCM